jgi:hypothetical protein
MHNLAPFSLVEALAAMAVGAYFVCAMPSCEQHILLVLVEVGEALFASEITNRINRKLGVGITYTTGQVVEHLKHLNEQVAPLPDGRWMLKRSMD